MRIETSLNKRDEAISRIKNLESTARMFGYSSEEMLEKRKVIYESLAKCPQWAIDYVRGYEAALTDARYMNNLVYGGFIGDIFYTTHSNREDYYGKFMSPKEWHDNSKDRGHYWKDAQLPFFTDS